MKTKYQRVPGLDTMSNGNGLRSFWMTLLPSSSGLRKKFTLCQVRKKKRLVDRPKFKRIRVTLKYVRQKNSAACCSQTVNALLDFEDYISR